MKEAPVYYMTKYITSINGHTIKVNLGKEVPYEVGSMVYVNISSPDGSIYMSGLRKVQKSGTSKAVSIPKVWGFKKGDLVYISVSLAPLMHDVCNTITVAEQQSSATPYFRFGGGLS